MKSPAEYRELEKRFGDYEAEVSVREPFNKTLIHALRDAKEAFSGIAQALFAHDIYTGPLPLWETARAIDLKKNPDAAPMVAVGDRMLLKLAAAQQEIAELKERVFNEGRRAANAIQERMEIKQDMTSMLEHEANATRVANTELATLRRKLELCERDAERYQWLRHGDNDEQLLHFTDDAGCGTDTVWILRNEELDTAIDKALADSQREGTKEKT